MSEIPVDGILDAYGVKAGEDRPDVVVSDGADGAVVAIGEAKFFTDETQGWRSAFRDAAAQIRALRPGIRLRCGTRPPHWRVR